MHEPLHGVAFAVERIEINRAVCMSSLSTAELGTVFADVQSVDAVEGSLCGSEDSSATASTILTGQLISEVREALNLSMLACPLRVVEPVYQCDLQCDQMQVGNLYGVLSKRRGVVTKEDIIEGTSLFLLSAHLPVANSFGFAQELLKKTSGAGTAPQLSFSHWQTNTSDPFWRPKTEEELEEFGETANSVAEHNLPRTFIDRVRKRKGLAIEEKVVASAEKQRTLNKKK
jgi:ribosome assembly protein 1